MRFQSLWTFISENCYLFLIVWIVLLFAVRSGTLGKKSGSMYYKNFLYVSAAGYLFILLYLTLLSRRTHSEMQMELSFLWEYRLALGGQVSWFFQILNNILLFVPMGVLYGAIGALRRRGKCLKWKYVLYTGAVISLIIEILQLVLRLGLFEFDDIFNNTLGMLLGYGLWKQSLKLKKADEVVMTEYNMHADIPQKITLGLVSDLHEHSPKKVLELLRNNPPDLIMIPGDIFERHGRSKDTYRGYEEGRIEKMLRLALMKVDDLFDILTGEKESSPEYGYEFFYEASKIAPVFYSLGNHEWFLTEKDQAVLKECGVKLLDNTDCEVVVKGIKLHIGGLSSQADLEWLDRFCDIDGYKILLCHHPEFYEHYLKKCKLNLILSGHAHGGQIRWMNKGLYSPGQGIFPKYTKGVYEDVLVVTAGASNTASVPRLGNPCEAVLIHLE